MKAKLIEYEHGGSFGIILDAETIEEAATIARFGINARPVTCEAIADAQRVGAIKVVSDEVLRRRLRPEEEDPTSEDDEDDDEESPDCRFGIGSECPLHD